jgi:hypothetical protein
MSPKEEDSSSPFTQKSVAYRVIVDKEGLAANSVLNNAATSDTPPLVRAGAEPLIEETPVMNPFAPPNATWQDPLSATIPTPSVLFAATIPSAAELLFV